MNSLTNIYGIPAQNFEVGILTPKELEIYKRALLPDKQIAWDLDISYYTVLSHLKSIRQKTGLVDKNQMCFLLGANQNIIN